MPTLDTGMKRKIAMFSLILAAVHLFNVFNIASIHPMAPLALGASLGISAYWMYNKDL